MEACGGRGLPGTCQRQSGDPLGAHSLRDHRAAAPLLRWDPRQEACLEGGGVGVGGRRLAQGIAGRQREAAGCWQWAWVAWVRRTPPL